MRASLMDAKTTTSSTSDRIRHRSDRALPRRAPLRAVRPPARIPPQHGAPARRTRPRRTARRRRPRHDRRLPPLPRDVERGPSLRSLRPQPGRARSLRGHASLPRDRRGSRLRRGLPPRTPFHDSRQDPGGFDGRAIRPTTGADDIGVIASWNTQTPDADSGHSHRHGHHQPAQLADGRTVATAQENLGRVSTTPRDQPPPGTAGRTAYAHRRGQGAIVDVPSATGTPAAASARASCT